MPAVANKLQKAYFYGLLICSFSLAPGCIAEESAEPDTGRPSPSQAEDLMKQSRMSVQELIKAGIIPGGGNSAGGSPFSVLTPEEREEQFGDKLGGRQSVPQSQFEPQSAFNPGMGSPPPAAQQFGSEPQFGVQFGTQARFGSQLLNGPQSQDSTRAPLGAQPQFGTQAQFGAQAQLGSRSSLSPPSQFAPDSQLPQPARYIPPSQRLRRIQVDSMPKDSGPAQTSSPAEQTEKPASDGF